MLFFMLQRFPNIKRVVINDINKRLTDAYLVVKERPDELVAQLRKIEKEYKRVTDEAARKQVYLNMRSRFNEEQSDVLTGTVLLFFLNKTCFNGLYRENSRGEFNVPFGRYANPIICNETVIYADSALLNNCDLLITDGDYYKTVDLLDNGTINFVYFDPPYRPLSATSSFNSYVKEQFDDESQRRLSYCCRELHELGNVLWMLSNADCHAANPNDTFFEELYQGFNFKHVMASRSVNANAAKRGKLSELLITNY